MTITIRSTPATAPDLRSAEILDSARRAFVEKGFDGASMQDLARAAGMSVGNFYRYFPSKAAIVAALITRDLDEVEQDFREILGAPVVRSLGEISGTVDLVNVFRRAEDLPAHLDALLALRPPAVWLQSGIRDDDFARALTRAGIDVVQDRCLMVEHRRMTRA